MFIKKWKFEFSRNGQVMHMSDHIYRRPKKYKLEDFVDPWKYPDLFYRIPDAEFDKLLKAERGE